jgi:hypothetical protein
MLWSDASRVPRLEECSVDELRAAIVANPFTPLRVAMILAATCRGRLRRIPHGAVHPRVRGGAAV